MKYKHNLKSLRKLYLAKKYKHGIKKVKPYFRVFYSKNRNFINAKLSKLNTATDFQFVLSNEAYPTERDNIVDSIMYGLQKPF